MKTLPCVGFELHYSPFERDCIENLGHTVQSIKLELSFDVHDALKPAQQIVILFSNQHSPTEKLYGEVVSCKEIEKDTFRVKIRTLTVQHISPDDSSDSISLPVSKGMSTPVEITLECPSCKATSIFHLIANQGGDWDKGIMPIYNCDSCGTTRAIISLLEHNHAIAKND